MMRTLHNSCALMKSYNQGLSLGSAVAFCGFIRRTGFPRKPITYNDLHTHSTLTSGGCRALVLVRNTAFIVSAIEPFADRSIYMSTQRANLIRSLRSLRRHPVQSVRTTKKKHEYVHILSFSIICETQHTHSPILELHHIGLNRGQ